MSTPSEPITDPVAGNPPPAGPDPATPPTPAPEPGTPPKDGDGDNPLGPEGEKALGIWKTRAKEAEDLAKDQAAKLKAYEDAEKTEAERQADALQAATERAEKATRLAVSAKVEAMAAGRFQDPMDAVESLQSGSYVGEDGLVDTAAITAALDGLLERKPHWAATEPGPRTPRPDPAQGARPGTPPNLSQRIAEAEQAGNTKLALALKTQQLREIPTPSK
ncbi:hypothetical protein [Streptomyces sp. NBC_00847]|uniref:hypothetical protein n=1 Tax=Streptomyces sp. NBC_00847 TaxID=2975850 RepID=UPI00225E3031|nr:hypothetical protein [Streptomyces sp. NBC_00847]MCX4886048.1 hypothetical protein [Streptomyces sp. NBC_00847]